MKLLAVSTRGTQRREGVAITDGPLTGTVYGDLEIARQAVLEAVDPAMHGELLPCVPGILRPRWCGRR